MNKYNLFLVIIWILILSICKNRIIKKFNNFFNFIKDEPPEEHNNLLQNIEQEFNNIKLILNTEVLSIRDKLSNITFKSPSINKPNIKTDLIDDPEILLNMNDVLYKTFNILKQFVYNIFDKIKNYVF